MDIESYIKDSNEKFKIKGFYIDGIFKLNKYSKAFILHAFSKVKYQ